VGLCLSGFSFISRTNHDHPRFTSIKSPDYTLSLPKPSPQLSPERVVKLIVNALQNNNAIVRDKGIRTVFNFATGIAALKDPEQLPGEVANPLRVPLHQLMRITEPKAHPRTSWGSSSLLSPASPFSSPTRLFSSLGNLTRIPSIQTG